METFGWTDIGKAGKMRKQSMACGQTTQIICHQKRKRSLMKKIQTGLSTLMTDQKASIFSIDSGKIMKTTGFGMQRRDGYWNAGQ